MTNPTTKTTDKDHSQQQPALPTFMDHVQELKSRLFWVAVFFVAAMGATYPFFQHIVNILVRPLGKQELYYMSPAGGLSFVIKVCMYAGLIVVLPVLIYHLYKFISPVLKKRNARAVLGFTVTSTLLAAAGVCFAYFVSLPTALHFLTNIGLKQVTAMLTIDAYMSFIIAYLLAGALLFQLPLIMIIINTVTPLPPKKLMSFQRHIIVISFVIAAIVSPTPDAVNQTILAAPMIVMYQIGIIIIWIKQRSARKQSQPRVAVLAHEKVAAPVSKPQIQTAATPAPFDDEFAAVPGQVLLQEILPPAPVRQTVTPHAPPQRPLHLRQHANAQLTTRTTQRRSVDGLILHVQPTEARATIASNAQLASPTPVSQSLDGFFVVAPS